MAKKITKEEFEKRFKSIFPDADFEVLEYTAISKPCSIKCNKCGKITNYTSGNKALTYHFCCETQERKIDNIKKRLKNNSDFSFVKQTDKDNIIIKHNICGNEMKRNILSAFKNPFSCKYCESFKKDNMIPIQEIQERLDKIFNGTIKVLEYNGQLNKQSKYKCLKCGLIFKQNHVCLESSRGCPKCDRKKSSGEVQMKQILIDNNIKFIEQKRFDDFKSFPYDFALLDEDDKIYAVIEVNGEQHYQEVLVFKDDLKTIQERDRKKRDYCEKHNIIYYEIPCFKKQLQNLSSLPFLR